ACGSAGPARPNRDSTSASPGRPGPASRPPSPAPRRRGRAPLRLLQERSSGSPLFATAITVELDSEQIKGLMSTPMNEPKRAYDATKRRERAEEERRATRRRVLAAAQRLFVERGYTATTMADIATEAGVAMQSVYKAGKSKSDLLQRVVEVVVAGDDQEVMLTDRPNVTAIAEETDAVRQVEMVASLIASTQERSAPVQAALRQAAAVDEAVAANLDAELRRRHETIGAVVGMIPA